MSRDELAKHVEEIYQTRLKNDVETTLTFFAEDGVFRFAAAPELGLFPPPVSKRTDRESMLRELLATWEWLELENWVATVDGSRAAVRYTLKVKFAPTGDVVTTELFDHLSFDESGSITEFVEFADTAQVAQLLTKLQGS